MGFETNLYKYLGLGVLVVFVVYILIKSLLFQVKMVEGLTNPEKDDSKNMGSSNVANETTKAVQKSNDKIDEMLAVGKNKKDYESMLITLDDYSKGMLVSKVININSKISKLEPGKEVTDEIINEMDKANTLKTFTDTLNSTMMAIDKKTK